MMGPTHVLAGSGVAFAGGTLLGVHGDELLTVVLAAGMCSRTPDRREWVGFKVPWRTDGKWRMRWVTRPRFLRPRRVFRHRGPTHWPETWLGLSLMAALLAVALGGAGVVWAAAAGFIVGYGMHLVADALTHDGLEVWSLARERTSDGQWRPRSVHLLPGRLRPRTGWAAEVWLHRVGLAGLTVFAVTHLPMLLAT
jgi:hypothetical protein